MSGPTGLRAPRTTGLVRPTPRAGLSKSSVRGTPVKSASRTGLKYSASNSSLNAGLSRSASSVSVELTAGFNVGSRVSTKDTDLTGTVRYYGEPQFAKGLWAGVELDEPQGKNDGSVKGVQYFTCPPNHGLFCKPDRLVAVKNNKPGIMRPIRTPSQTNISKVNYEAKFNLQIGSKVLVNDAKTGTLLYLGLTEFAKGVWAGVALDTPDGKNDGSVKGKRYFTCDPDYGLFAQAPKIKLIDSPYTSTSSLSETPETPRKTGSDVMKPDFNNRTPAPTTPGISSSLSGILRSRSKDIDIGSMQKNIGDLQQRLSEVTPHGRTLNGPSTYNNRNQGVSEEYEKLKKLHEESDKERAELREKILNLETEKLTYENRVTEVAEAADQEKTTLNKRVDTLNKEILVLNANHTSQTNKLETELKRMEQDLQSALETIAENEANALEYEANALQNDNSAELAMNQDKITELQEEIKLLRSEAETDKQLVRELEEQITINKSQSNQSTLDLQTTVSTLEKELADIQTKLSEATQTLQKERDNHKIKLLELTTEKEGSVGTAEELKMSQNRVTELENDILEIRSTYEHAVSNNDNRVLELETDLSARDNTISTLKQNLSDLTSNASSDKLHLEQKISVLESDRAHLQDQSVRDKERISYLEKCLSENENDTQLGDAHSKISQLENTISNIELEKLEEVKAVNKTVMELQEQLTQQQECAAQQQDILYQKYSELQISLDKEKMARSMSDAQHQKQLGELHLQLAELDKVKSDHKEVQNLSIQLQTELAAARQELGIKEKSLEVLMQARSASDEEHNHLVACLENNIDELQTRIATLTNDKVAANEAHTKQVSELERETAHRAADRDTAVLKLQEQLAHQTEEFTRVSRDYDNKCAELETVSRDYEQKLADMEIQLQKLVVERDRTAGEVTELQEHLERLEQENQQQILSLQDEHEHSKKLSDSEKSKLQKELSDLKIRTNRQSDEEIENLHKQINNLTEENDILKSAYNDKNAVFDELSLEVTSLRELSESAFSELKKNEVQFNESVKALKFTQVQLDEAIRRTKELQVKVNDLEEEVVRERARANELEQLLHHPPVMSFEDVDNLSNLSSSPISAPLHVPDRVFCDNCDVFDDHETDRCPVSSSPGGSRHGGHHGLSGRPYCTVCEMFGHTADECEDDMTF